MTMESVLNFREMGGLPTVDGGTIRHGRLFRSGHWSQPTDGDLAKLAEYDLAAVIDFRADIDREGDGGPDRLPDGPDYLQMPMSDVDAVGEGLRETLMSGDQALIDERFGNGRADELASEFVTNLAMMEQHQETFGRFLRTVADVTARDRALMWHCSAGKDRAGWASTLVGMALGVEEDALVEHYEASNIHRPVEDRLAYYAERGIDAEIMRPFLMVHGDYLRNGLQVVDATWGSREAYLDEALGFGPEAVAQLRERLIVTS